MNQGAERGGTISTRLRPLGQDVASHASGGAKKRPQGKRENKIGGGEERGWTRGNFSGNLLQGWTKKSV